MSLCCLSLFRKSLCCVSMQNAIILCVCRMALCYVLCVFLQNIIMLSVSAECYAVCLYSACRYPECLSSECNYILCLEIAILLCVVCLCRISLCWVYVQNIIMLSLCAECYYTVQNVAILCVLMQHVVILSVTVPKLFFQTWPSRSRHWNTRSLTIQPPSRPSRNRSWQSPKKLAEKSGLNIITLSFFVWDPLGQVPQTFYGRNLLSTLVG